MGKIKLSPQLLRRCVAYSTYPRHTHMRRYNSYSALAAMGALKLTDKYQTDYLRDRLVHHIEADWPKSPMEWIAMYRIRQAYAEVNKFHGELPKNEPLENQFPEPVSAIQLARNCDIPSILPAAFLALVGIDVNNDWDDLRADGDDLHFKLQSARWGLLDNSDRDRLDHGRAVLLARCEDFHETVVDIPADICRGDILDCQAELKFRRGVPELNTQDDRNSRLILHGKASVVGSFARKQPLKNPNPMHVLQEIDDAVRDYNLCAPCRQRVRQRIALKMQECWAELSTVFDLSAIPIRRA